jgi:predicted nucleic acid-binding protein
LGLDVARRLADALDAGYRIVWVDQQLHRAAWKVVSRLERRQVSLVDCTSFQIMEQLRLRKAFAFDSHFKDFGFEL